MTESKQRPDELLDLSFEEAVTRFIRTDRAKFAKALASEVLRSREAAKQRIEHARKELEDGARSRQGRFRL